MRHRRRGRKLGRSPKHQRALLRSLASALFLTEYDFEAEAEKLGKAAPDNLPKDGNIGRITTTLAKAKEVRPLVEKCITIARRSLKAENEAKQYGTTAVRNTEQWRAWRNGDEWYQWNEAIAPAVAARRRALKLLGNKRAVRALFDEVAPRFADRNGGYTRILRLASPRLGDAGARAILEFVGRHDRVQVEAEAPSVEDDDEAPEVDEAVETGDVDADEAATDQAAEEDAGTAKDPDTDQQDDRGAAEDQQAEAEAPEDAPGEDSKEKGSN